MATAGKAVIVIGVDDSEYSTGALEWTLDNFFSSSVHPFKLVVVYAKPMPDLLIGVGGPGSKIDTPPLCSLISSNNHRSMEVKPEIIISDGRIRWNFQIYGRGFEEESCDDHRKCETDLRLQIGDGRV